MKRMQDYAGLSSRETMLHEALDAWPPDWTLEDERAHEEHLLGWLQRRYPDVPMLSQYGIAKGKADIVIEDRYVIELKLGFGRESVGEFDRCIGQLERYKQKWVKAERGPVDLVVVGNSDTEFRDLLHTWIREANGNFLLSSPFHLIEKRVRGS